MGYVEFKELPYIYSLSDVFLSSSVNDAGPSMVNQAIACGTPVISFEMGSALDVVKDKESGITVPLRDSIAMAKAISDIYNMDINSYQRMRKRCRDVALQYQSYQAFTNLVHNLINK